MNSHGLVTLELYYCIGLAPNQVTMGVPFYGRVLNSGEWITYEDLVQRHAPLATDVDTVYQPGDGARIQQHSKKNKGKVHVWVTYVLSVFLVNIEFHIYVVNVSTYLL